MFERHKFKFRVGDIVREYTFTGWQKPDVMVIKSRKLSKGNPFYTLSRIWKNEEWGWYSEDAIQYYDPTPINYTLAGISGDKKDGQIRLKGEIMDRGYFGIGVENMKTGVNYGTLFRSAFNFGADFIFLIGKRFQKQCSDTTASYRHLPLHEYTSAKDFIDHLPYGAIPIAVEITKNARDLRQFQHPERAVYILGPEDGSISDELLSYCPLVVKIPTALCLNVSVAGSIILYDRILKRGKYDRLYLNL